MDSAHRAQRAFEVGYTRHSEGDLAGAVAAFTEIARLEDPFVSAKAAVLLGRLLEDDGDLEGAAEKYVLAAGMDHHDWSTYGKFDLAKLNENKGQDEAAAEALFDIALSGHRVAAGRAGFDAGMLLAKRGDERSIRALEVSAYTNDPDSWPVGAAKLAALLPMVGREADGHRSLERARSSGNTRVMPLVEAVLQQLGRTKDEGRERGP